MRRGGIFLFTSHLMGDYSIVGLPSKIKFASTRLYTLVEIGTMRVKGKRIPTCTPSPTPCECCFILPLVYFQAYMIK